MLLMMHCDNKNQVLTRLIKQLTDSILFQLYIYIDGYAILGVTLDFILLCEIQNENTIINSN
jgi:hypothetical protein